MSEPEGKRRRRPRVALCAAITFDGKLDDTTGPLPPALRQALAPGVNDAWLIEPHLAGQLPPGWEHPARIVDGAALRIVGQAARLPSRWALTTSEQRTDANVEGNRPVTAGGPPALQSGGREPAVRRWLCLGGPELFRALLDAALVNDLYLLVRPCVDGRRGAPTLGGPFTPEFFSPSIPCRLRRMEVVGGECFLHYTVARRKR